MKKFYNIEIDSQVELENGKTLGKLEESKISVNDGNCGSGGGAMVVEVDDENRTANYTPREVYNAMLTGVVIAVSKKVDEFGYKYISSIKYSNGEVKIMSSSEAYPILSGDLETNTWAQPK